eukprot:398128-Prymnesium_polylepis.1
MPYMCVSRALDGMVKTRSPGNHPYSCLHIARVPQGEAASSCMMRYVAPSHCITKRADGRHSPTAGRPTAPRRRGLQELLAVYPISARPESVCRSPRSSPATGSATISTRLSCARGSPTSD